MTNEQAVKWVKFVHDVLYEDKDEEIREALRMAIEALSAEQKEEDLAKDIARRMVTIIENEQDMRVILKSTDAVPQSEQYKKGFEDAKRAFEFEFAREAESIRKRNAELEAMLNIQKELSAEPTDLISRADAIKAIESRQTEQWIDADVDYNNGLESAVAEIKALPSADRPTKCIARINIDVDEVVKRIKDEYEIVDRPSGEWIDTRGDSWVCSNCGVECYVDEDYRPKDKRAMLMNYCHYRGVKMGGDK